MADVEKTIQEQTGGPEPQDKAENTTEAVKKADAEKKSLTIEQQREMAQKAVNEAAYGTLILDVPFRSDGTDITELSYDFKALSGMEYTAAMDSDKSSGKDTFHLTDQQALALFAAAAAKRTAHVDKDDVLRGLSITDTIKAVQLSALFFVLSSRAGNLRISKK